MSTSRDSTNLPLAEVAHLRTLVAQLQQERAARSAWTADSSYRALDAAQVGTWEWDQVSQRVIWSSETEQIFGLPPGKFEKTFEGFIQRVHEADRPTLESAIRAALADRQPYHIEHRIMRADGVVRWVSCRGRALLDKEGSLYGMAGTIEDVTARKDSELSLHDVREDLEQRVRERTARLEQAIADLERQIERRQEAEAALKASERQYQLLYNDNPSMYFTLSQEGTVLSVNDYGGEQLGYTKEELTGRSVLQVFDAKDHQTVLGQLIVCAASPGRLFRWEIQKVRKDGRALWVRERARAVKDETGTTLILVVCEDVTIQKQVETSHRESEQAIRSLQEVTSAPGLRFEQRMQALLELGCRRFKLPTGAFTTVLDDQLEMSRVWPPTGAVTAGMQVPLRKTYCSATLHAEDPLSIEHAGASEWRHHPGYAALGLESYIGAKLSGQHKVHGTICFFGSAPYPGVFSKADKDFLLLMAQWITGELDRQEAERRLERINECFLEFGSDPLANITRLTALCGELLGATCALYSRLEGGLLCSIAHWQTPPDFNPVDKAEGHLCCDLISRGEDDVSTIRHLADTSYAHTDPNVGRLQLQTYIGKVVKCGKEAVGALCVVFQHDVVPPEADERLMNILASAIGTEEERLRAQKALRVSEERFKIAFRSSPHPVLVTEFATGCCLEVNEAALKLFGYDREEVIGHTTLALGIWPALDDRRRFFEQLQEQGAVRNREVAFRAKDRSARTLLISGEVIELNGTRCLITVGNDITEQKHAEAALREGEERWKALFEHAGVGIAQLGLNGKFLRVNTRLCQTLGYSSRTFLKKTFRELTHPNDLAQNLRLLDEIVAGTRPSFSMEKRYLRSDGAWLWTNMTVSLVRSASGSPAYFIAVVEDMSERKRAEEALRTSEVQWQRFVADAPVGLVIVDEQKRVLSANKAFCKLTGYTEKEIIGDTYALYTHPDDLPQNFALTDEFFKRERSNNVYETRYARKDGDVIWVSVKTTDIELPGHAGPLLLAVVEDITQRKQATEDRERISRDLHDDVLQSLYAIGMGLETTKARLSQISRSAAKRLEGSVTQLNGVIHEVRSFIPRMQSRGKEVGDFELALRSLVGSLTATGAGDITVEIDTAAAASLPLDHQRDMIGIAKEALSNSVRHTKASRRAVAFDRHRGTLRLSISDNGKGFQPGRTRKGMGLSNMRARAKQLGGRLAIRSAIGQGTRIVLTVPQRKQ